MNFCTPIGLSNGLIESLVNIQYLLQIMDIVVFDNSVLHGTLTNHSLKPRISIDFRIVSDDSPVNLNRKSTILIILSLNLVQFLRLEPF